jgi:hypothetical protein
MVWFLATALGRKGQCGMVLRSASELSKIHAPGGKSANLKLQYATCVSDLARMLRHGPKNFILPALFVLSSQTNAMRRKAPASIQRALALEV